MYSVTELLGKTFVEAKSDNEAVRFTEADGTEWMLYHAQDCCESVYVEDLVGNLEDLVGSPLLMAEEATSDENPLSEYHEKFRWTFYKFATIKGYVTVRFYGASNGYYGVGVDLHKNGSRWD